MLLKRIDQVNDDIRLFQLVPVEDGEGSMKVGLFLSPLVPSSTEVSFEDTNAAYCCSFHFDNS